MLWDIHIFAKTLWYVLQHHNVFYAGKEKEPEWNSMNRSWQRWKSGWTNDHCWWRDRIRYVLKERVDKRPLLVERQNQVCVERAGGQTTTAGGETESGMCWKSEWTNGHCWWRDRIRYVLKERVDKRPLLVERQNQVCVERAGGQTTTAGGETESGMCWRSEWTNGHCWWRDRIRYVLKERVDKRPLLVERQNQVCVERASGQTTTAGGETESGMCCNHLHWGASGQTTATGGETESGMCCNHLHQCSKLRLKRSHMRPKLWFCDLNLRKVAELRTKFRTTMSPYLFGQESLIVFTPTLFRESTSCRM